MSEAATTPPLHVEIATIAADPTVSLLGYILTPRDEVLMRRGGWQGLRVYQDLARDGHAGSVLRKRRAAVISREWSVDPASEDPQDVLAADIARAALKRVEFDRACQGLLAGVLTGLSVAEIIWEPAELTLDSGRKGTWIVPRAIKVKNPRRFIFDREERLRLRTREAPQHGIDLPDRKFVLLRYWAEENEDPYGRGLGHDLFWPIYFKRNGVALWNALIEKFGQPFVYAEYPSGTPEQERDTLVEALQNIARNAGLAVPAGTLIKVLEAGRGSSSGSLHQDMIKAMNAEISKIVLGETLTTEMGENGARAASETHNEVREELAKADADLLSGVLNGSLMAWIAEVNVPGAQAPKVWRPRQEEPDLKELAELDRTLFAMGWQRSDQDFAETYGQGYQRRLTPSRPPQAEPPEAPDAAFAEDPSTLPDLLADRLARDAAPSQAAMLAAIRGQVDAASSFADLEERLLRLSGAMPIGGLVDRLAPAMAAAHLAGRSDVQDEAGSP